MRVHKIEDVEISADDVVLDTCILMDLLFAERPRYAQARALADHLIVEDYLTPPLASGVTVEIGGSDMIFAAIALKHGLTLVTEDERLQKRAAAAGILVFDAATFAARLS